MAAGFCSPPPSFDHGLGLLERVEYLAIAQFIAQLAVEGFAVAVFSGAGWFDIGGPGADGGDPLPQGQCNGLRTVLGADVFGHAVQYHGISPGMNPARAVDPAWHGTIAQQSEPPQVIEGLRFFPLEAPFFMISELRHPNDDLGIVRRSLPNASKKPPYCI